MARLTCDWDDIKEDEFRSRIENFKKIFIGHRIEARRSAGRKGFHVIVHSLKWKPELMFEIRRIFHDDQKRVACDVWNHEHGIPISVLFSEKNGKKAEVIEL